MRDPAQEAVEDIDDFLEEDAKTYGRENFDSVAGPYLIPYIYKGRFLDKQYGIRGRGRRYRR